MSSNSYAYRNDRNAHDAIAKLVRNFHKPGRIFIAEYDFSKFFDNILHDQLFTVAKENGILWTSFEKDLIQKFLQVNPQEIENYNRSQKLSELKTKGIPQGNSISLFLANVAAMNLDLAIEKSGVGYVRYADDTILWSDDYSKLNNGIKALEKQANELGLSVNALKSNGVNLFIKNGEKAEITSVENVNFLGYRFNRSQASIKEETLNRIKKKVENLVYRNLISSLKPNCNLNSNRLAGDFDKDYWTLLFQLRRYIYGGMTDQKINKLLQGKKIRIVFPGVMSYFPLVSDEKQLGDLDAWMFALIRDALVLRKSILLLNGYQLPRQPYDSLNGHLLKPMKVNLSSGKEAEIRIPSFKKIGKLIYETASIYGPNAVSKEALDESYIYGLGSSNF
jgi:hypothetical protein